MCPYCYNDPKKGLDVGHLLQTQGLELSLEHGQTDAQMHDIASPWAHVGAKKIVREV